MAPSGLDKPLDDSCALMQTAPNAVCTGPAPTAQQDKLQLIFVSFCRITPLNQRAAQQISLSCPSKIQSLKEKKKKWIHSANSLESCQLTVFIMHSKSIPIFLSGLQNYAQQLEALLEQGKQKVKDDSAHRKVFCK